MKKKILLVGPLLTRSGYGEQARFALRALRSKEDQFDIYIQPIKWGETSWVSDYNDEKQWIDDTIEKTIAYASSGGQFDMSLQVTIPIEFQNRAPVNIGYTAGIETTKVAPEWLQTCNAMEKVIVVSNHAKNVFEATSYTGQVEGTGEQVELTSTCPISVVNYPVKTFEPLDLELELKHDVNFLCVAQMGPRKNLNNTIRWFMEEFKDDEVGLVVKTNRSKNCLMDRRICEHHIKMLTQQYSDAKCNVYLLHGDMTDQEMHALYKHEKISAFVCLAHGEGFGLPYFESMYSGLPVVAPGWSGQNDFLFNEDGKEMFYNVSFDIKQVPKEAVWDKVIVESCGWAYPREVSAKEQMRACYNDIINNEGHAANAENYASYTCERFSEEKMLALFADQIYSSEDIKWEQALADVELV
tara:strand:+ start:267 stop:1505 length:1239 start_codon:yes stop_codon:yes gene_type:complete